MHHEEVIGIQASGGGWAKMKMLFASVVIAVTGGSVHWMRHSKKEFSWLAFGTAILTAAFVGMQAHFFMRYLELPESLQFSVVGVIGYGSGTLLDAAVPLMIRWAYKKAGVELPTPRRRAEDFSDADEAES